VRFLPGAAPEPPPRYVAFVAAHLEPLRRDALTALGDEGDEADADRLYAEVLADVALRWRWLEFARWLRRPEAVQWYLRRSLVRRSQRRHTEPVPAVPDGPAFEFVTWRAYPASPRRVLSSGASRIAQYLRPAGRTGSGVLAEAAVAWWHAFEARRRRWLVGWAVAGLLLIGLIIRLHDVTAS